MIDSPELPARDLPDPGPSADERRRRARRTALVLGLVALSFYVSFIVMSVLRAQR